MRIALIGPTHPYKGGIAHHTTELAHKLKGAGHDVQLLSWSEQYPGFLYPGVQRVPNDKPETKPYPETTYPLSWKNPAGWAKVGRSLRKYDAVVFVFVTSVQAPAYLTMLKAMGRKHRGHVVALCHNVLPHERKFFDVPLTRAVLSRVDQVMVHTQSQAEIVEGLTTQTIITVAEMAPHLPAKPKEKHATKTQRSLLFFGLVRKYKGVDVLLRALAQAPNVRLTIAGEIWGGTDTYDQLIAELNIQDRVTLRAGYIASQDLPELFAQADAVVLPYRSGTATQNVYLAHAHGIPVIATKVGSMAKQVRNDIDGLLCKPDDVDDLAKAINHFYEKGVAAKLQKNIPTIPTEPIWEEYIEALLAEVAEKKLETKPKK